MLEEIEVVEMNIRNVNSFKKQLEAIVYQKQIKKLTINHRDCQTSIGWRTHYKWSI